VCVCVCVCVCECECVCPLSFLHLIAVFFLMPQVI
jgi:hypothetical protein